MTKYLKYILKLGSYYVGAVGLFWTIIGISEWQKFNWFLPKIFDRIGVLSWVIIPLPLSILIFFLIERHTSTRTLSLSEQLKEKIDKAVFEMRGITSFNLCWTGIRNDNNFLEYCINDFSETWLIQAIKKPTLTGEMRRQIKIVNRHLATNKSRHQKVKIILFVYRNLNYEEKASLFNQLQLFSNTESLSSKIQFQVWDKSDIAKALQN